MKIEICFKTQILVLAFFGTIAFVAFIVVVRDYNLKIELARIQAGLVEVPLYRQEPIGVHWVKP